MMIDDRVRPVSRQFVVALALAACDLAAIWLLPNSMTRHLLFAGTIFALFPFTVASCFIARVLLGAVLGAICAHLMRHKRSPIQDWARSRIGGVRFALSSDDMSGPHVLFRVWILTSPFAAVAIYFLITI